MNIRKKLTAFILIIPNFDVVLYVLYVKQHFKLKLIIASIYLLFNKNVNLLFFKKAAWNTSINVMFPRSFQNYKLKSNFFNLAILKLDTRF